MTAKHCRALALTSVLVASMMLMLPPSACPIQTPWSTSTAYAVPPGATPPGDLSMSATLDRSDTVKTKGTLRTQTGQLVSGALINLAVDGKLLAVAVTDNNGTWSSTLRLPSSVQGGDHELSATFDGTGGVGAASARGTFSITPQATVLTAAVKPTVAAPGALLNVNGTVTLSHRHPVTDSQVAIWLGNDGDAALTTPTDPHGNFQATIQVPLDVSNGPFTITVKLVDSRYGTSQKTLTIQVKASTPTPTPSPTPTPTPSSASPTPSPTPAPTPDESGESQDGRIPQMSTSPVPVAQRNLLDSFGGRKPLLIFAAVLGVLVLGVLVGSITRHHGRRDKGRPETDDDADSLFEDWDQSDRRRV
ncbi:MAG: hypothetical protein E6243_09215 [Cutibacterium avidum]|uniref:hypothetical protein n=1 Tax=Cutibacterium avidum TaxID=33010 RepID=UPI001DF2E833|nr:hypothetical protein [Cutibacterium avidum]MBS6261091.1 hypothetical protein [Propionibacterium sp.]MCO6662821.1 hypothetical protein [Cutibacterium avidum]MCO6682527.1 hypothetical protein [Cutibacterium avidum]MCO6685724.1 hypothetical protein [Cutibacterium avidum]MCO6687522.1 hypothetical protein [Cutibacterium avidum]